MKSIVLLLFLCGLQNLSGQSNCAESLITAKNLFDNGKIMTCIQTLEPCIEFKKQNTFEYKEDLVQSYRLLAISYLVLSNAAEAEKYTRALLLLKPDYKLFPNIDPEDFRNLVERLEVKPIVFLGLKTGINLNTPALLKSYSAYISDQSYNMSMGYQLGLFMDKVVSNKINISAEILIGNIGINHQIENAGGFKQIYEEQQNYTMLNARPSYKFHHRNGMELSIGLGCGIAYLNRTNVFFEAINIETQNASQASQNPIQFRKRLQNNFNAGAMISIPMPKGFLQLEFIAFRYNRTTVIEEKRLEDLNFILNNYYINDDIQLRPFAINIAYKLPIKYKVYSKI